MNLKIIILIVVVSFVVFGFPEFVYSYQINEETQCWGEHVLVYRINSEKYACVFDSTAQKWEDQGIAKLVGNPNHIQPIIKTGTDAGRCVGYCIKDFTITPDKIVYSQNGREFVSNVWVDLPEKTKETLLSKIEWKKLITSVDFQKFNSLPDKIGCPGCADAPVEWIEISYGEKTKRVEFESQDEIPEIDQLVVELQKIRNTIESSIDSFEECVAAGNSVMESYPRQCETSDGKNFIEEINSRLMSPESLCQKYGGNWLQEFNECETISKEQCSIMNGTFNECESACRHQPDSKVCTLQCIPVCVIP
jgi:hypothetical protein